MSLGSMGEAFVDSSDGHALDSLVGNEESLSRGQRPASLSDYVHGPMRLPAPQTAERKVPEGLLYAARPFV